MWALGRISRVPLHGLIAGRLRQARVRGTRAIVEDQLFELICIQCRSGKFASSPVPRGRGDPFTLVNIHEILLFHA